LISKNILSSKLRDFFPLTGYLFRPNPSPSIDKFAPYLPVSFHPTVRELHREFLRAGSDVMQTFTFYASDDKLGNRGNTAAQIGVSLILLSSTAIKNCYQNSSEFWLLWRCMTALVCFGSCSEF